MGKLINRQKGFAALEAILALVIVVAIVGIGWFVYNAKKTTDKTLTANTSATPVFKKKVVDPTADWTTYKGADGKITLKYPKSWVTATHPELCGNGILLLGADSKSVGICASENVGQIHVTWGASQTACGDMPSTLFTVNSKTVVTVNGVAGTKQQATAKSPAEGPSVYSEGTKVLEYCFTSGGYNYTADYAALSSYPDALSDFNLMVTKTLKFN